MNGRLDRAAARIGTHKTEAERKEERRKLQVRERVIAELNALEARRRSMTPDELEAWRNSPEGLALKAELDRWEAAKWAASTLHR